MPTYNPRTVIIQNTTENTTIEQPIENITNEYNTNNYYQLNYHLPAGIVAFFPAGISTSWTSDEAGITRDPNGGYWLFPIFAYEPKLSIGNLNSTALIKSLKLQKLFELFWGAYTVLGGKGNSAIDDWNANKAVEFDSYGGRFFRTFDDKAPVTEALSYGELAGSDRIIIPPHTHNPVAFFKRAFDPNAAANVIGTGIHFNAEQTVEVMPKHIVMMPLLSLGIHDTPIATEPPTDPPTEPPTDPPTEPPTDPPAGLAWWRGINLGTNSQMRVGSNTFYGEGSYSNLTLSAIYRTSTLEAFAGSETERAMLQTRIEYWQGFTVAMPTVNGEHEVYLWFGEDGTDARVFNVELNGVEVATDLGGLAQGQWQRYGPFATTVTDGNLTVGIQRRSDDFSGPNKMISALEIWR